VRSASTRPRPLVSREDVGALILAVCGDELDAWPRGRPEAAVRMVLEMARHFAGARVVP
jgi:hypothetical protein